MYLCLIFQYGSKHGKHLACIACQAKCQCRHELDISALTGCLEREEKARTEEAAEHATAAAALQKNIADLQASTHGKALKPNMLDMSTALPERR